MGVFGAQSGLLYFANTIPAHLFVVRKRKKCIFSLKKCFLLKSHGKLESVAIAVNPFLLINF